MSYFLPCGLCLSVNDVAGEVLLLLVVVSFAVVAVLIVSAEDEEEVVELEKLIVSTEADWNNFGCHGGQKDLP